jgi:type I restriction enzyme S subunit
MSNGDGLPMGWEVARLDDVANVSSNRRAADLPLDTLVNFVPMSAVKEEFGGIDISTLRPLTEVQKGYTQFREGDVLFAKITPCMENGKVAVVPRTKPLGLDPGKANPVVA